MRNLSFFLGLAVCFCSINIVNAQSFLDYQPLSYAPKDSVELIKTIEAKYKKQLSLAPKAYRNDLEKIYKTRNQSLQSSLKERNYIFDGPLNQYLDGVLAEVSRANPQVSNQEIRLLLSRSAEPNASCLGNGFLTLNVGLTRRFESESQLAFVVCHELAHHYLNHVDQATQQYLEKLSAKSTQQEIRKISDSDSRTVEKATELLKTLMYDHSRHSRFHEAVADSLALIYLKKTNYDEAEAIRVLALLDTVDKEKYTYPLNIKQTFDSPNYPFKDAWLQFATLMKVDGSDDAYSWNKDSLKTHPDCSERIRLLKRQLGDASGTNKKKFLQAQSQFDELVLSSDFEVVEGQFHAKRYARCLQQSMLLLQKYPSSPYLRATIGKCFYRIYEAQKNHELGKYVPMSSPEDTKEYRQLLEFIHNLGLRDVSAIGYYFLKKDEVAYDTNEDFVYALAQLSKSMNELEESQTLKKDYLKRFPKGKYVTEITKL